MGLFDGCVEASADALDAAVGPARMKVSTDSALERTPSTPRETLRDLAKVVRNVGDRGKPACRQPRTRPVAS